MTNSSTAVAIIDLPDGLATSGLRALGQHEFHLPLEPGAHPGDARRMLEHFVAYVQTGARVEPEQTLGYGYWHVRARLDELDRLALHELTADGARYVPGATLALAYWATQRAECERARAEFRPPRPDHLAAVSPGALEDPGIEGIRYPAPEHMSGWYFTSQGFEGSVKDMLVTHLVHVTARRPDLARYVSLPAGFRIRPAAGEVVFDPAVANEEP
jgi:hypothetical protein